MKKLWNWLVGVEHTVEHIISDLTDTVKRLEQRAADQWHHAAAKATQIEQMTAEKAAHMIEAANAEKVASKIGALFS